MRRTSAGVTLGNPAQREERRPHPGAVELGEQAIDIRLHPARDAVPVRAINAVREGLDLEIVLDIHAHGVAQDRTASSVLGHHAVHARVSR